MSEVTRILKAVDEGDSQASSQLLPLVYDELRRLAAQRLSHEKVGQTLDPTALVHEANLRLVKPDDAGRWDSRGHFFAAAARAMRRILVENARRKRSPKHGGVRIMALAWTADGQGLRAAMSDGSVIEWSTLPSSKTRWKTQ
jgi:RNA polymerase sigma factor (TIGR02999 family)